MLSEFYYTVLRALSFTLLIGFIS